MDEADTSRNQRNYILVGMKGIFKFLMLNKCVEVNAFWFADIVLTLRMKLSCFKGKQIWLNHMMMNQKISNNCGKGNRGRNGDNENQQSLDFS